MTDTPAPPPRDVRRRRALRVLTGVKAFALFTLLLVAVIGGLSSPATVPVRDSETAPAPDPVIELAMTQHDCSVTGLGGEIPSSALVRTPAGQVRQVSFDRGWAVYTGERPGTLLAVCRGEVDPGTPGPGLRRD